MKSEKSNEQDYYGSGRREMLQFIPWGARKILDIGCGAGTFGANLKSRQSCEVWGMEINTIQGQSAAGVLDKVITGDAVENITRLPQAFFDCMVCNDFLEHIVDPFSLLQALPAYIAPGGVFVASIPNVRYYRVIKDLVLRGDWRYKDSGVLDIDHLRFFTRKSIMRMFAHAGWRVDTITGINPTSSRTFRILNLLLLGLPSDIGFRQFAVRAHRAEDARAG